MRDLLSLIRWMLLGRFRSKASLEAEILALRHQLNVLRRTSPRRPVFSNFDRMIFVCLYRIAPQGWRTFLLNHADGIASIDLFVVPTISFKLLYGLLILRHDRRRIVWLGVTTSPTSEWIARQVREACGWEPVPDYLVRDRDRVYGQAFARRLRAMGIRDRPTAPRSPLQNGYAERLIGSIRRVVVIIGERHLRHVLRSYQQYYNGTRTHLSLAKDSPLTRSVQAVGRILPLPILGGLHHHYVRN